ncbi:PBP1A family penicillin-binding protein [Gammaproteobacteria bacterium]|nr:PBP1A family penicillin-binding protein [Gammaproteobacteria bacterium]
MWKGLKSIFIGICVLVLFYSVLLIASVPSPRPLVNSGYTQPLKVYSQDHQLIGVYGHKHCYPTTYDQFPKSLIDAFVAAEDQRFYFHYGVDLISVFRAVKQLVQTGQKKEGASTITMQVARAVYLGREKTYIRKIKEMILATWLEIRLTKKEILTLYLNRTYFGAQAYGVVAAAKHYYQKSLDQLSLPEIAMLAGLPKAPSIVNPLRNPEQAKHRRHYVLTRMLELTMIDQTSFEQADNAPICVKLSLPTPQLDAPHVSELVRKELYQQYGDTIYQGFAVQTTIVSTDQQAAVSSLRQAVLQYTYKHPQTAWPNQINWLRLDRQKIIDQLNKLPRRFGTLLAVVMAHTNHQIVLLDQHGQLLDRPVKYPNNLPGRFIQQLKPGDVIALEHDQLIPQPMMEGSIVLMEAGTGKIRALVGGYYPSYFNHATQAFRQPASAFKPFIYASAIEQGKTLATPVKDLPFVMEDTSQADEMWRPQNHTHQFHGLTRLKEGLVRSINLVSIQLLAMLDFKKVQQILSQFGFQMDLQPKSLSLALGSGLVSPFMMTEAISIFPNQGERITPTLIERIDDAKTKTMIYQAPDPDHHQVITKQTAYLTTHMLQEVVKKGTGRYAYRNLKRSDLAGKTGTSNHQRDAWFVGFTPQWICTTWMGFDDHRGIHAYAASTALPLWTHFMQKILAHTPDQSFPVPDQLVQVRIDQTGHLARPDTVDSFFEYFHADHLPEDQDT